MRRTRRRSRRRSQSRSSIVYVCALLLVIVLVVWVSIPSASFSHGKVPRGVDANVTGDENGALTLDNAQAVYINDTSDLVNVTNRLGRDVTITVTLRSDSTHIGNLTVNGNSYDNEVSFSLSQGATETVRIKIPDDSSLTDEVVYFHVTASAPGLTAKASDREVQVNA